MSSCDPLTPERAGVVRALGLRESLHRLFIEERSVDLYVHDEGRQRVFHIARRHLEMLEHKTDGTDKTLPYDPEIIMMKR